MERVLKIFGEEYPELIAAFGLALLMYFLIRINEKTKGWEYREIIEVFTFLIILVSSMGLFALTVVLIVRVLKEVISE